MIINNASFDSVHVEDMDSEGFLVHDADGVVWLSHEQVALIASLSAHVVRANTDPRTLA